MTRGIQWSLSSITKAARTIAPLALAMLLATIASACPTCTDGLEQNDPQGQAIAAGFYYSILFMMAMPFTILATFGGLAYLSIRRAQKDADTVALAAGQFAAGESHPVTMNVQ